MEELNKYFPFIRERKKKLLILCTSLKRIENAEVRDEKIAATDFCIQKVQWFIIVKQQLNKNEDEMREKRSEAMNGRWVWKKTSKAIKRQTLEAWNEKEEEEKKLKGASVAFFSFPIPTCRWQALRIYLPNCQYLMFNVFVHLLILAEGIIITWFMHSWGCRARRDSLFLFFLFLFSYHFLHNKSNIVFFITRFAPTLFSVFFFSLHFSPPIFVWFDTCVRIRNIKYTWLCLLINYVARNLFLSHRPRSPPFSNRIQSDIASKSNPTITVLFSTRLKGSTLDCVWINEFSVLSRHYWFSHDKRDFLSCLLIVSACLCFCFSVLQMRFTGELLPTLI